VKVGGRAQGGSVPFRDEGGCIKGRGFLVGVEKGLWVQRGIWGLSGSRVPHRLTLEGYGGEDDLDRDIISKRGRGYDHYLEGTRSLYLQYVTIVLL